VPARVVHLSSIIRGVLAVLLLGAASAHAVPITRGPYLQSASASGVTLVFRTAAPGVGAVRFGPSAGALSSRVVEPGPATEHVLRLEGLQSATRYFYALELDGAPLVSGPEFTFRTYPSPGTDAPFRFFAWGDSGDGSARQARVAAEMIAQVGEPDFLLILGDNIYPAGEPENYDPHYFQPYAPLLRKTVIWPTIGNHDVMTQNGQPYVDAFYLPANNPEGSELYYSFDYGNAHFISLATDGTSFAADSPQMRWAAEDLARSKAQWKFAFFHRPPYTGGTHSDDLRVQAGVVPVLEAAGVDAVFCGHSHVYERTFLLQNGVVLQSDKGSYTKYPGSPGTLYVVSGAGGEYGGLHRPNHPLMAVQQGNINGALVVDVAGKVARGYYLHPDGSTQDLFSLYKGQDTEPPRVLGVRAGPGEDHVTLSFDEPVAAGQASGSAEDVGHYALRPALPVKEAHLGPDLRTVTLTTDAQAAGTYVLSARGVSDLANPPNALASVEVSYAYDPAAQVDAARVARERVDAAAHLEESRRRVLWGGGVALVGLVVGGVVLARRRRAS